MSEQIKSLPISRGLVAFHSIYFIALGAYALFFTDNMLASVSENPNKELAALLKCFGAMLILAGFFCYDLLKTKSNLARPLIYLLFYSFTSLHLMTLQEVAGGIGDLYFVFRSMLTLLITIALSLEFTKDQKIKK